MRPNLWKRSLAKYSRWLHIYGSMIGFAVVLFFSVTGITLNHPDWMTGAGRVKQLTGQIETQWVSKGVAKLEIVEYLRRTHGITGALSDFRVDDAQCSVSFKGPGYTADAFIDRQTGKYDVTESNLGFLAIVNDLHKGRDTGGVWKGAIDVSAALLTFISLTGLLLLFFLHKHRLAGFILLGLGALVAFGVYRVWVP